MPRFVLLRHVVPTGSPRGSHWDVMLEQGDALATWAIERLPLAWADMLGETAAASDDSCEALELPAHRLAYLDYQGPVSGDRGEVTRCDRGEFTVLTWSPVLIEVELQGEKLTGRARLTKAGEQGAVWRLTATPPTRG
ncbi:MAG: hypothetical protein KDA44_08355 [Planctomycetales bacterium]|nr:hypothetical protein [Planctomycetales bacterium]